MIGTVQRELWEVVHFDEVAEVERGPAAFFADDSHRRGRDGTGPRRRRRWKKEGRQYTEFSKFRKFGDRAFE